VFIQTVWSVNSGTAAPPRRHAVADQFEIDVTRLRDGEDYADDLDDLLAA